METRKIKTSTTVNNVNISKTLTWLLRHAAVQEGLPIDEEGFIELNALLKHPSLMALNCSIDVVKHIVKCDKKKRYQLVPFERESGTADIDQEEYKIKANQGHSIQNIGIINLKPYVHQFNENIIHGTYYRFWSQIKSAGLKVMSRNHIHFTNQDKFSHTISGFRSSCEILIYINVNLAINDGITFLLSENNVILSNGINGLIAPRYFLKVIDRKTGKRIDN